jgi:DNA helicase HerA-like ATPase
MDSGILVAKGAVEHFLLPQMANRHGLIAGATGTGKTVTLRVIAEQFSEIGVPVFLADVKGDLSGLAKPGTENQKITERLARLELQEFSFTASPVEFWDLFGESGNRVRATISDMGPLLLSRLLNLNETQAGVLSIVFKIADDHGLLLLDLKDLKAMLQHVGDKAAEFRTEYGNISPVSIGAIQRNLLVLQEQGGDAFFGEPALNLEDLMQTDAQGRGVINILAAEKLVHAPKIYATFLLWLIAELFENLPEVGDPAKPKLVFFFDEAHLLFDEAPRALLDKIEQVVRLIRSKGVGIYFVTQNPLDVPDSVLGQLGNRVQHALRAFTPRDQKAVRAAAETFRQNPKINVEQAITELEVGEALVSFLDEQGRPNIVDRALILPPRTQFPPMTSEERQRILNMSAANRIYAQQIDRESAYEKLKARAETSPAPASTPETAAPKARRDSIWDGFVKSAARSIGTQVGRELIRGVLGSLMASPRRRRRY